MKIVSGKLTLARGPLSRITRDIIEMPGTYKRNFAKNSQRPIQEFNNIVQSVPSRQPAHPFIWSKVKKLQNKARRWWFAAINGKIPGVRIETQNGRYKRKSDKIEGIGAEVNPATNEITITAPGGGFGEWTVGKKQVPSHKRTGWVRFDKEVEVLQEDLIDVAFDTWFDVTSKAGDK